MRSTVAGQNVKRGWRFFHVAAGHAPDFYLSGPCLLSSCAMTSTYCMYIFHFQTARSLSHPRTRGALHPLVPPGRFVLGSVAAKLPLSGPSVTALVPCLGHARGRLYFLQLGTSLRTRASKRAQKRSTHSRGFFSYWSLVPPSRSRGRACAIGDRRCSPPPGLGACWADRRTQFSLGAAGVAGYASPPPGRYEALPTPTTDPVASLSGAASIRPNARDHPVQLVPDRARAHTRFAFASRLKANRHR